MNWSRWLIQVSLLLWASLIGRSAGQTTEKFIDIDAYIKYNGVVDTSTNQLRGAESSLEFQFRYCNDHGMLLYQDGGTSAERQTFFFALGISAGKIYLEWKVTSGSLVELYIGDGSLVPNTTYTVVIFNLGAPQVGFISATVNGRPATAEYLTPLTPLDISQLTGPVFLGGYQDVTDLRVNTERLNGYLVTCINYVRTSENTLNFDLADDLHGVKDGCPLDFCAPPTVITVKSSEGYLSIEHPLPPGTRTILNLRFRTMAPSGMLFYFGGPAYLTVYMDQGRLTLGLNTKGSGAGTFATTTATAVPYNDGDWKYIRVTREGRDATLTDESGRQLASVSYPGEAQTLNAGHLIIGGLQDVAALTAPLPAVALASLRGCFEGLRFISFSISPEPPELINFKTQRRAERNISHDGCFPEEVCEPLCPFPSQQCNFDCSCAAGFRLSAPSPLTCENIDDCAPSPCLNGATCEDGIQDYTCHCTLEFNKGKNCSIANNCIPSQCQNGARCNDFLGGFNCTCADGYEGPRCATEIDECASNPCVNAVECRDAVAGYQCVCQPGYEGVNCETDVNECLSGPCLNGATCRDAINHYDCICADGWEGPLCGMDVNECLSAPCANGATCEDGFNAYACRCAPGWEGPRCGQDVDECAPEPCRNGATCAHGVNQYTCFCPAGWMGRHCDQDLDECLSAPCLNLGVCRDALGGYTCQCGPGFEGVHCEVNIDECLSSPCLNGGLCQDGSNAFTCLCAMAWEGPVCGSEVDECLSNPCANGGQCSDRLGAFLCNCPVGFLGSRCEVDIDECVSQPCLNGGACRDMVNGYACDCRGGYAGSTCALEVNECSSAPCLNGGSCADLVAAFGCVCVAGYAGQRCEAEIDECLSQPCHNGAQCLDRLDGFNCACAAGYEGALCQTEIDDCLPTNDCRNGALCVDGRNAYTCTCSPGWAGTFCSVAVDECLSAPCQHGGTCVDLVAGFRCDCPANFQGVVCEADVNECLPPASQCHATQTLLCQNSYGDFNCRCFPGFVGKTCEQNIDECASQPCYFGGTCVDLANGYACQCPEGFLGQHCEAIIRECNFNPCGQNSVCVESPAGGHTCYCSPGYHGDVCQFEIQECGSNPCLNGGLCDDEINGYNCNCLPGFEGTNCEVDIDECASIPCGNNGYCRQPLPDMYECICQAGYSGNHCQNDIDECATLAPCQAHQICVDLVNGFSCECPTGMEGPLCATPIDSCLSTPCLNGGMCFDGDFRYSCLCGPGYQGINCEIDTDVCDPPPCFHGGTCSRVPGAALPFTCVCADGFTGDQCEGDIYDCRSSPCLNNGTCVEYTDGTNGFACRCPDEYVGSLCQVVKTGCLSDPCQNQGTCENTDGGFVCHCRDGWSGAQCQQDTNECLSLPCLNGGLCVNSPPGSFRCFCLEPYWTGDLCQTDFPECQAMPPPCRNGGVCIEQAGADPLCNCSVGFEGPRCETQVNECASLPCLNGGQCQDIVAGFLCSCSPGYQGDRCESEIYECVSSPCQNNGTCYDLVAGYNCTCAAGYNGTHCETDTDECRSEPCANNATCEDMVDAYACHCAAGFAGVTCEQEIDECASQPCLNGGNCTDLINGYRCTCPAGYTGIACEFEIDECASSPCVYGECFDFIDFYNCSCNAGYQGYNCDVDIRECASNPCLNGAECIEPTLDAYQCVCPQGTSGVTCGTVEQASFAGNGALKLPPLASYTAGVGGRGRRRRAVTQLLITLEFVTTVPSGVLLYNEGIQSSGRVDHLALELYEGTLHVSINVGSETVTAAVGGGLSDGQTHKVSLSLVELVAGVAVDDGQCGPECVASLEPRLAVGLLELNRALYVGGPGPVVTPYMVSKLRTTDNFVGCLENFNINDELVSLAAAPANQSAPPLAPGCPYRDNCLPDPCLNGGLCLDLWSNYSCRCQAGFAGRHCEVQTLASFVPARFLHFARGLVTVEPIASLQFSFSAADAQPGLMMYTPSGLSVVLMGTHTIKVEMLVLGGVAAAEAGVNLANGDWYRVRLTVNGFQLTVQVTNEGTGQLFTGTLLAPPSIQLSLPILFGSLHSNPAFQPLRDTLQVVESFTGCIRDLYINDANIQLQWAAPYEPNFDPPAAEPGCPREENCDPQPCANQGVCVAAWTGFTCQCTPDYFGVTCEEVSTSTFNGLDSSLRLIVDARQVSFGDRFGVSFRTRDTAGVVLLVRLFSDANARVDHMLLRLDETTGTLQLQTKFGIAEQVLPITANASDAEWQELSWVRHRGNIVVDYGGQQLVLTGDFPMHTADRSATAEVWVGSSAITRAGGFAATEALQGCVRDLSFNGQRVHYLAADTPQPGVAVSSPAGPVAPGCTSVDVCRPEPCPVNSNCVDVWNLFECICLEGWQGEQCDQSVDDCIGNLCARGATCQDGHMTYACLCPAGLTGPLCNVEINACDTQPCHATNAAGCVPVFPLDYDCRCLPGFKGKNCSLDNRRCTSAPCQNGGNCTQTADNLEHTCACPEFYEGDNCETYNSCFRHNCLNEATCVRNGMVHTCSCGANFYGDVCEFEDACLSGPCENGGTCARNMSDFLCTCTRHYEGANCELPIDQCEVNRCANGATCFHDTATPEVSFTCTCAPGFAGPLCQTDIAECGSDPCMNGADCIERPTGHVDFPGYECNCVAGYAGVHCETDVDECISSPCLNQGHCVDQVDRYRCSCVEPYDGTNCELDTRTCAAGGNLCQNGARCQDNGPGLGIRCLCELGFGGEFCGEAINACHSNPCEQGGSCSYVVPCQCPVIPQEALDCGQDEACQRRACQSDPTCTLLPVAFACNCTGTGYQGVLCEQDVDECTADPDACHNDGECINLLGAHRCNCTGTGFTGPYCTEDIDECATDAPCLNGGRCINNRPSFECQCPEGFEGRLCEVDIDECQSNPCQHDGVCSDGTNGFTCHCNGTGYDGFKCEDDIDECDTNTAQCQNGAECDNSMGNYSCKCSSGYEGRYCQQLAPRQLEPIQIIVPLAVLALLLAAAVAYMWWYLKQSRKMKGKYNPAKEELDGGMPLAAFDMETDERLI